MKIDQMVFDIKQNLWTMNVGQSDLLYHEVICHVYLNNHSKNEKKKSILWCSRYLAKLLDLEIRLQYHGDLQIL